MTTINESSLPAQNQTAPPPPPATLAQTPAVAQAPLQPPSAQSKAETPTATVPPSPQTPGKYTVEDLNATRANKAKIHEIKVPQPNGKFQLTKYRFGPGEKVSLPQPIALLFLEIDPSFRVRNSHEQIVRSRRSIEGGERKVSLKQDEMVVPVTWILKNKLLEIARDLPGGRETFKNDVNQVNRVDLEEFIIAGGKSPEAADEDLDMVAA